MGTIREARVNDTRIDPVSGPANVSGAWGQIRDLRPRELGALLSWKPAG